VKYERINYQNVFKMKCTEHILNKWKIVVIS